MKCSFCGNDIAKGRGIMIAKPDGTIFYFCSSKCRVNGMHLRRNNRKLKWTAFYEKKV